MKKRPLLIGIAGGTGSGKTTIANKIKKHFKNKVVYLAHDSYYRDLSHLSLEERKKVNFDHPNALETSLFIKHFKPQQLLYLTIPKAIYQVKGFLQTGQILGGCLPL